MRRCPEEPANMGRRTNARCMRWRRTGVLAGCLAIWLEVFGASPPPRKVPPLANQVRFLHLTINEGLSQNTLNAILQDRRGFMWFGTEDGLNRYDGYTFRIFSKEPGNPHALCDDDIRALCEDRQGRIWVGTANGLSIFDPQTERFQTVRSPPGESTGLTHPHVTAICEDGRGAIWVGTQDGLNRRDPASGSWTHFRTDSRTVGSLRHPTIHSLVLDRSGTMWLGTQDGLHRFDPATGRFPIVPLRSTQIADPGPETISCLYEDPHGFLWIAARDIGLYLRPAAGGPIARIGPGDEWYEPLRYVKTMAMDRHGRLWAGTHGSGVVVIEPGTGGIRQLRHFPTDPTSLSYDLVTQVFYSPSDIMWVGTYGKGIDYWSPFQQKFECYQRNPFDPDSLGVVSVRALFEDRDGLLWVGGYSGLDRIDRAAGRFEHLRPRTPMGGIVRSICEDPLEPARWIWLGMENSNAELHTIDRRTGKLETSISFQRLLGMPGQTVFDLFPEATGDLWIGTENGLIRLNVRNRALTHFRHDPANPRSLSHSRVNVVFRDSAGILWVGTHDGLNRLDPATSAFERFRGDPRAPSSLSNSTVFSLLETKPGLLWVGTAGGLNRFETGTGTFSHVGMRQGLPNDVIYGILPDARGCLWMSTNRGLCRYDPATGRVRNFDVSDGLQSNEFNSDSYFRSTSGELFFGGINGFNAFRPEAIVDNPHPPPVWITELLIDNRPVPIGPRPDGSTILARSLTDTREVTLPHRDRVVTIGFAALNFLFPEKNQYAYILDGWDRDWQPVGNRRYVSWARLPPGDYRLRVKAANNDGVWSEPGTSLVLHILPPFYATWWFRLLMLALLAAGVASVHIARTVSIRNRNRRLEEINAALREQIAERQRAEEELRRSEEKYRTLTEDLAVGIFRASPCPDARLLEINPALVRMLGFESRPALLDQPLGGLFANPEDWQELCRQLGQRRVGQQGEVNLVRSDGTKLWCSVAAAVKEGPDGTPQYIDGLCEDITTRKRLEAQVRQSQKLEAIGQLAGGIAHDFNNILTVINGRAEIALLHRPNDDPVYQNLFEILQSGRQASELVRQLLAFSRRQSITRIPLDLNSIIRNLERMLHRLIGEDIALTTRLSPGLPAISADPGQLEQVLMNLTVNARDAIQDRDPGACEHRITIETALADLDETYVGCNLGSRPGLHAMLSVSDTGVGMSEEVRGHIFEPFFTTKPPGRGTGLGLATVFGIVQQNEGSISVYSEPGTGTTLKIYWPVSAQPAVEAMPAAEEIGDARGQETILVVEDDAKVREFTVDGLRGYGYRILHAADGIEALRKSSEAGIAIDLLVTDVIMPRMSGPVLATELRKSRPGLRVLFTSGYTDRHLVSDGSIHPVDPFLAKPYSIQALARKVREVLDHPAD